MTDEGPATDHVALDQIVHKRLEQPGDKNQYGVNQGLEQDRVGQRFVVEPRQERQLVRHQDDLADDQRRGRGNQEPGIGDEVVGKEKPLGQQEQIEADKKE